jgi:hypothetical protein
MGRAVTLFSGQWADLGFDEFCGKIKAFGYDGVEIACWGDHMDVKRAATEPAYVAERKAILKKHGLSCWALGAHLAGQCVGDLWDPRLDGFVPGLQGSAREDPRLGHPGDEVHRPGCQEHGLQGGNRLHGQCGLEVLVLLPPDQRRDGKRCLQGNRQALDAHPGRVRRLRRQVCPGSPSHRDSLRLLHGRSAC